MKNDKGSKMKIALVCSHGGHITEILELMKAFEDHEIFFVTHDSLRASELKRAYTIKSFEKNIVKFFSTLPLIFWILWREKPDIIISTGSEIAIPFFYIGRAIGIKTIFIESICRVKGPSFTGKIVYPVSDVFLVQWEQLLSRFGKKAQYWGAAYDFGCCRANSGIYTPCKKD
jgi:beta-1,4-N-acetylglucosaminyltransferase